MIKDYFLFGFKNLRRRGIRSWLTLLGILIGIAAVVALITLGQGLQAAVNSQFGVQSTEMISVQAAGVTGYGAPGTGVVNPLTKDDVDAIEKLDTVEIAIGRSIETIKVEYNDKLVITSAYSVQEGDRRKFDYESQDITASQGRLLQDGDTKKVNLGYDYSDKYKSGFDKAVSAGDKITIQGKKFTVIGILSKKGSFIIDKSIGMNEQDLDDLVNLEDEVDVISVKVKSKELMDEAKEDIEKLLRDRRDVDEGEEDFTVETPEAALETVNQILGGVQAFVVIIAFMSIIVGAIGIINTMTTSVLERRREIGIMKAVGARNGDIFLQFLIEAGLMGLIGGLIGIVIGINIGVVGVFAINNFIGATTRPVISLVLIIGALIGSFIIGSMSGIAPAMLAAKENPVEALRD